MTRRAVLAGSGFSPLSIPWYAAYWASDPSWTNPGNDSPVASWRDATGNGRTLSQADGTKRPLYRASSATMGGRPAVRFDGVDDWLMSGTLNLPQPYTLVVVGSSTLFGQQFVGRDAISTGVIVRSISSGGARWNMYGGTNLTGGVFTASTPTLLESLFDGASSDLRVNGSSVATGNAGSNALSALRLGADYNETAALDGPVAFVGVRASALTAQQRDDFLAWSRSFYGTP